MLRGLAFSVKGFLQKFPQFRASKRSVSEANPWRTQDSCLLKGKRAGGEGGRRSRLDYSLFLKPVRAQLSLPGATFCTKSLAQGQGGAPGMGA